MEKSSRPSSLNDFCHRSSRSNGDGEEDKYLECNICFQSPKEAVVSFCGHLFCWPCLYTWLHVYSQTNQCPVCKSPILHHQLVPLYTTARDSSSRQTQISISGIDIPSRPTRQRPETSPPSRSGANFFSRRQLRSIASKFSSWIDNMIIILLCGVLFPALVVLSFKVWTSEIRNSNGVGREKSEFGYRWVLYKQEKIDYKYVYRHNGNVIREGLLQSGSFHTQYCLYLFVVCMLVAVEFRVAG